MVYNQTNNDVWFQSIPGPASGASNPTMTGFFYNTTDNRVYYLRSGTPDSLWFSFPIAIITTTSSVPTSIDQVFNGFGYIGSTIFALPGVNGLISDGRNADGTLKNIVVSSAQVRTATETNTGNRYIMLNNNGIEGYVTVLYDEVKNILYNNSNPNIYRLPCGTFKRSTGGVVSDFNIKTVFHAVDYNDLSSISANKDLSNLSATGKNIGKWSNNISNCITEIPQDIKLELSNGTLTLKAGSKVYVPNGSGVFDVIILSSDTNGGTASGRFMYTYHPSYGFGATVDSKCFSGSTAPSNPSDNDYWYDTTNNKVKRYISSDNTWREGYSLPICISSSTEIYEVFNGFGYIGSTVFALPDVKGLIPNGRNSDGTLKNIEVSVSSVKTAQVNQYTYSVRLSANSIQAGTQNLYLNEEENFVYDGTTKLSVLIVGALSQTSGIINSFTPKTAFHAVDYNDLSSVSANRDLSNLSTTGQAILDNKVNLSDTQTITGVKNITGQIVLKTTNTTIPNNSLYGAMAQQGNSYFDLLGLYDTTNSCRCATIRAYNKPDQHGILLASHNFSNGSPNGIEVSFDDSNNLTTKAHTPSSATNNSTEIATTAWVYNHEAAAVDGQWTYAFYTICSDISGTSSYSNEFDVSSYLPADGQKYEVLLHAQGHTGKTSGNTLNLYVGSSETSLLLVAAAQTRTSSTIYGAGAILLPVGTNRKIELNCQYQTGTSSGVALYAQAYRRIGTNP